MTQLIDQFGRSIDYVRVSVTDRCDLRCSYCMPKQFHDFHEPEEWLSFDELERVIAAFTRLGTRRVRLTGGEPLVRKDLPRLASQLSALPGLEDLSLSTNCTRMNKHAEELKLAGIDRINVSLDSLDADKFKQLTGGKLEKVLNGLMAAKDAGLSPIKVNMVVMKDINDNEVEAMVDFCIEHGFTLRFIETMPVGDMGRKATDQFIDLKVIKQRLEKSFDLVPGVMPGGGPARYMNVVDTNINIGFITPLSQHFCETCNRVRISVDGTIYTCLGQNHNFELRPLLRAGISDAELEQAIRTAVNLKPEKHEFNEHPEKVLRFMSYTGG
ncbi:MAG: GTP 3',8-cyclase MoaA [Gammaproteobacteria bacterium]|nr:GTP 3',8-cyclase MoaA [Gammaproteobacteria bacterium]